MLRYLFHGSFELFHGLHQQRDLLACGILASGVDVRDGIGIKDDAFLQEQFLQEVYIFLFQAQP